jgi:hypothetical protein
MDKDGYDDLITLDDSGEINILYGKNFSNIPDFRKKLITDEYGILLEDKNIK